jgi:subtilisin-like proprotein convertase family protein
MSNKNDLRKVEVQYEHGPKKTGYFHKWGVRLGGDNLDIPIDIGIIEMEDGKINTFSPSQIRFIEHQSSGTDI